METESLVADFFDPINVPDLSAAAGVDSVDAFLRQLRAPERFSSSARWLKKLLAPALLTGLALGTLAYLLVAGPRISAPPPSLPAVSAPLPAPVPEEILPAQDPQSESPPAAAVAATEERVEEKFWQPLRERSLASDQYRKLLANGWKLIQQARYPEAAVSFGRAVRLNTRASEAYYGLALAYFEQGLENEALSVIERVTGRQGGQADLWLLLGTAYQFQGDEAAARKAYGRYLKLAPAGTYARDVRALLSRKELPRIDFE